MQDIIVANIEERIQNLLPLHDSLTKGVDFNISAQMLISNAKSNDEYVLAAAKMYSNIEENLIYKYKLNFQDEKFIISYEEYIDIANTTRIGDRYLLKRYNRETGEYELFSVRVLEFNSYGKPMIVEMPPVIRFIKVGLSAEEAKDASDYWTVLNKIRHKSPDNEEYLTEYFSKIQMSKKEFLMSVLEFFKKHNLYTKE